MASKGDKKAEANALEALKKRASGAGALDVSDVRACGSLRVVLGWPIQTIDCADWHSLYCTRRTPPTTMPCLTWLMRSSTANWSRNGAEKGTSSLTTVRHACSPSSRQQLAGLTSSILSCSAEGLGYADDGEEFFDRESRKRARKSEDASSKRRRQVLAKMGTQTTKMTKMFATGAANTVGPGAEDATKKKKKVKKSDGASCYAALRDDWFYADARCRRGVHGRLARRAR